MMPKQGRNGIVNERASSEPNRKPAVPNRGRCISLPLSALRTDRRFSARASSWKGFHRYYRFDRKIFMTAVRSKIFYQTNIWSGICR